jgi:hypothetical protein
MDTSLLLTIFLAILSVIASIYITKYYSLRKKITIFNDYEYWLFNSVIDLPKLQIKFNDKIVESNIIAIKYIICNTGNSDIETDINSPFTLILPEEFIWKKFEVSSPFEDLQVECGFFDRNAKIAWIGLFRKKEFVELEAMVEYIPAIKNEKQIAEFNLINKIKTKLRVKNLHKIKKKNLHEFDEEDSDFPDVKTSIVYIALLLGISIWGCYNIVWVLEAPMLISFIFFSLLLNTPIYVFQLIKKLTNHIKNKKDLNGEVEQ